MLATIFVPDSACRIENPKTQSKKRLHDTPGGLFQVAMPLSCFRMKNSAFRRLRLEAGTF